MATPGLAGPICDALINSILSDASFTAYGPLYVQLHTGDPGSAGTSNVATESTRESTGTMTTSSGGAGSSDNEAAITWTSVAATETYSYCSLWSASSGGTFIASGTVTGGAVVSGDTFTFPISDLVVSIPTAS
jgi:hypothetical protein